MTLPRQIIHLDRDAFYAAAEPRDYPDYRHQPVIVGGDPDCRGLVATWSYQSRRFGLRSLSALPVERRGDHTASAIASLIEVVEHVRDTPPSEVH